MLRSVQQGKGKGGVDLFRAFIVMQSKGPQT